MQRIDTHFANFRFDLVAQDLYQFVWNDYCDWFVELAKLALGGEDQEAAASTRHTLLVVLEAALRALHPIIPFVTEEIWQEVAPRLELGATSILDQSYPSVPEPSAGKSPEAYASERTRSLAGTVTTHTTQITLLIDAVEKLRKVRSELGIAPGRGVPLLVQGAPIDPSLFQAITPMLKALCRLESIRFLDDGEIAPAAAHASFQGAKLLIPLAGLIDLDAERARVAKELKRVETEIAKCQAKLGSATFVANAPAAVVEQERQRLADWGLQLTTLREHAARLG